MCRRPGGRIATLMYLVAIPIKFRALADKTPHPVKTALDQRYFCLSLTLIIMKNSLTFQVLILALLLLPQIVCSQAISWKVDAGSPSSSGPMILLENGNTLHIVNERTAQTFTERTPEGITVNEFLTSIEPAGALLSIRQVRTDTFLALSNDGSIILLSDGLQSRTIAGSVTMNNQLCQGQLRQLRNTRWEGDTLVAWVTRNICDENLEVRAYYAEGEVTTEIRQLPDDEFMFAYAASGDRASLSSNEADGSFRLEVMSAGGELVYQENLNGNPWYYSNLQFDRSGLLYVFGSEYTGSLYVAQPIKIDLATGQHDTLVFSSPDYHPFVSISGITYVNDQLVFCGAIVEWEVQSYLYALDDENEPDWQFPAEDGLWFNSFQDIVETEDGIFLSGNRNQSDIIPSGNAYIMRLDQLPVSLSEVSAAELKVYPNPAGDEMQIVDLPPGVTGVNIVDAAGRITRKSLVEGRLDLHGMTPGIYVLEARKDGKLYLGRFVKE